MSDELDDARTPAEPDSQPETQLQTRPDAEPGPQPQEPPAAPDGPTGFRIRRAPRYRAFGFTGAGIGIAAGVIVALTSRATSDYASFSTQTIAGYFAVMFGLFGGVIGLGLAVLIERRRP